MLVHAETLGEVSETVIKGPFQIIVEFIDDAFYIAGIVLLIAAIHQFKRHRQCPQEIPISTPIVYLLLALVLILLPLIYKYTHGGM